MRHPQPDSRTWNCFRSSQADAVLPVLRKFRVQGPGRSLKNLKKANCIAAERPFAAQAKIKDVIVLVLPVPHSNKWLDTAAYCMSSCSYCITLYNRLYNLPHRLRLLDGKLNIIVKNMLISSKPIRLTLLLRYHGCVLVTMTRSSLVVMKKLILSVSAATGFDGTLRPMRSKRHTQEH